MSNIGNLVVRLEANIAKFESDLGRAAHIAEERMEAIRETAERAVEGLKKLDERFIGIGEAAKGLAAAAIAGGLVELVKGSLEAADQMGKMAQKSGVAIESLSRLSVAAKLSDVDTQTLAKGMGKLSQSISAAAAGTGVQAQAFEALGIRVRDAHGNLKNADTIMAEVSDRFAGMQDGSGKTAVAMAMFGKAGADLIPMLNNGSEELNKFADLSDRLGLTLDASTSQAAQDVNDRFTTMGMALRGIGMQVMRNMLPTFDRLSQLMVDTASNTDTMRHVADGLSDVLKGLVATGMGVAFVFERIGNAIGAVAAAADMALHGNFSGAKATLSEFMNDTQQQMAVFADNMNKLMDDSPVAHASEAVKKKKQVSNFSQRGTTSSQDASAEMSILQGMRGNFDQQMRARAEQMNVMSASARQLAQEYDKIAASESRARESADKMHAAGRMSDEAYLETLQKVTMEAERQRDAAHKLQEQQDALNASWEHGASKALQSYLDAATNTAQQSQKLFGDMFKGMEDALVNFAKTGKLNFTALANSIIDDLIRIATQKAIAGMLGGQGGWASSLLGPKQAMGGAWINGVQAFAQGGVVNSPTLFPHAGGMGLMGEAGPEAIMPLKRGADGRLGVAASGARQGGAVIQINVQVDAQGQASVTGGTSGLADLGKRIGDVSRQVLLDEMRPGGLLAQAGVHAA